jgi:hypothetical protein
MQVPNFVRRIFLPVVPEDTKPKFVDGAPVAGSKHSSIEQQQQKVQNWAFPNGRSKPWIER